MALLSIIPDHPGPATHVMVIGVGSYAHLNGGSGPPAAENWNLKQLSSAPLSAQHFIQWLVKDYRNSEAPLASIEHLISSPHQVADAAGTLHASQEPTMANLYTAYKDWKRRAGSHPDNIAIFYFCGHGLYNNNGTALLAADFADPDVDRIALNAVHVEGTVNGMLSCAARRQCFFIDSCRTVKTSWQEMMDSPGQPLGTAGVRNLSAAQQPIFYATGPTQVALAPAGKVSLFTKSLVEALQSLAAVNPDGDFINGKWVVDTSRIEEGVNTAIKMDLTNRPWLEGPECYFGGSGKHFNLHDLPARPAVPVIMGWDPSALNQRASFEIHCAGTLVAQRLYVPPTPQPLEPWESRQPPEIYQVKTVLDNGYEVSRQLILQPPMKRAIFIPPLVKPPHLPV